MHTHTIVLLYLVCMKQMQQLKRSGKRTCDNKIEQTFRRGQMLAKCVCACLAVCMHANNAKVIKVTKWEFLL